MPRNRWPRSLFALGFRSAAATFANSRTRRVKRHALKGQETLEVRQMLAANPVINEFLPVNTANIRDQDGTFQDWLELGNNGDTLADLSGYYLTNDPADLDKWQIPATTSLAPGGYLVVFASGKNRAVAGSELHTNFTLSAGGPGTFLALVAPNGTTIVDSFTDYPAQAANESYGRLRRSVATTFLNQGTAAQTLVPDAADNAAIGSSWQSPGFVPGAAGDGPWTSGPVNVGYETANVPSGWTIDYWKATTTVGDLNAALNVIATRPITASEVRSVFNINQTATTCHYLDDQQPPGVTGGDVEDYVVRGVATIFVPPGQGGTWTLGYCSDDGARLSVDGTALITDVNPHAPADYLVQTTLTPGTHTIEYIFYERGGGSGAEVWAAQGAQSEFDSGLFNLIGDAASGGLATGGLQSLINTDIETAMRNVNGSAYVRVPFAITSPDDVQSMKLDVGYDDGFVAYLNGTEVLRRNAPASPAFNSNAVANSGLDAVTGVDLLPFKSALVSGNNVLAIHGLNATPGDGEFFIAPKLTGRQLLPEQLASFKKPTPGSSNGLLQPVISEFMADNNNTITDQDAEPSDWLELFNPGQLSIDLAGYYLTDDPNDLDKWQFPSVVMEPSDHLLVFASGKNRRIAGEELHTNFTLDQGGGYLALVLPDGVTKVHEFTPSFPSQQEDVSYGYQATTQQLTVLAINQPAKILIPTSNIGDAWKLPGFDTAGWIDGLSSIGFELDAAGNYDDFFQTNLRTQMRPASGSGSTSVYLRVPFQVDDPTVIKSLTLGMQYDDGFVAWLNGTQIAAANAPATLAFNSTTLNGATHADGEAVIFQPFDVTSFINLLQPGENILAIHGLDAALTSSDFIITPRLIAEGETTLSEDLRFLVTPTPGAPNNSLAVLGFVGDTNILTPHGFYNTPQSIAISNNSPGLDGVQVYFTTNGDDPRIRLADGTYGADPSPTAQLYTGPFAIAGTTVVRAAGFKPGFAPSIVKSASYLYVDDIVTQSLNGQAPPGWPTSWGANIVNYGMDPDVIGPNPLAGNAPYQASIKQNLLDIPTWSIVVDLDDMFSPTTGIYANPGASGRDWERPASCEVLPFAGTAYADPEEGFQSGCGIRIRGGFSRSTGNPKHAFRLFWRNEYGDGKLDYPLFGNDPDAATEFDKIDLKTSQNYSWAFQNDPNNNTFTREMWSRWLQRDMDQPYTRGKFYHVYINGVYWGLFDTQERSEASYGASYLDGGDRESYDAIHADSQQHYTLVTDGNFNDWIRFVCAAQDIGGPRVAQRASACGPAPVIVDEADRYARYMKMQGLNPDGTRNPSYHVDLDVDNLIVYMLAIIYSANADAPVSNFLGNSSVNNWFGVRKCSSPQPGRVCDGQRGWAFFAHDNEHTLGTHGLTFDRTGPWDAASLDQQTTVAGTQNQANPQSIFEYLWTVPEFRLRVADISHKAFFNNGVLTPAANTQRFLDIARQIGTWTTNAAGTTVTSATGPIVGESARWGDGTNNNAINPPATAVNWAQAVVNVINSFFPTRSDIVLNQLRGDGPYPQTPAPTFSQFGGGITPGFQLTMTAPQGAIYYTNDGSDPRQVGGGISSSAIPYSIAPPETYLNNGAAAKWIVPTGAAAESGWQNRVFPNDATWNNGTTALGYDTNEVVAGPGFLVRVVDTSSGNIGSIDQAVNILNGNTAGYTVASDTTTTLAYVDIGDGGNLNNPPTLAVPGTTDREHYAVRATANVTIPVGTWSIAVGSDDGFRLTIPNVTFTSRTNADAGTAANILQFGAPRGHAQTSGVFTVSGAPLTTSITLEFYEQGGGDSLELSIFNGNSAFNAATFQTLQNGTFGWTVQAAQPNVDFDPLIATQVETAMKNVNTSLYARLPFTVSNPAALSSLILRLKYDDGVVVYLNGTEVARRNAPGTAGTPLPFNAAATQTRFDTQVVEYELIDISAFRNQIVVGDNVLAVQLLNRAANDTDVFFDAKLDAAYVGSPITLNDSTRINARVLNGGEWSAMTSADFTLDPPALRVTELNYNPAAPSQGEINLGFTSANLFEFIELQNVGPQVLNLGGVKIDQGITFTFASGELLNPGERIVIVANQAAFEARYGTGRRIGGTFAAGNLSNDGESIRLATGLDQLIQQFRYEDDWYPLTDGAGYTLVVTDPNAPTDDWNLPAGWHTSYLQGGSPAQAEAGTPPASGDVVVTEILAHTNDPAGFGIELHNRSLLPIDVSRWFISDDEGDVTKYQLPASLPPIPAGGRLALRRATHGLNATLLSPFGGTLVIHASDGGTTPIGYRTTRSYDGAELNVSQGPHTNADGQTDNTPFVTPTLGAANSGPKFGPVVMTEIMYNSPVGSDEYIELKNLSAAPINLQNWSFREGVSLTFGNVTIPAGGYVLAVGIDPALFRARHPDVPANVTIVGPYSGVLDNGGETIALYRPGDLFVAGNPNAQHYVLVEAVDYDDDAPWPTVADGAGPSLSRVVPGNFGSESTNWLPSHAGGTPGYDNTFFDTTPPTAATNLTATPASGPLVTLSWNPASDPETGVVRYTVFRDGVQVATTTGTSFSQAVSLNTNYSYRVLSINGDGLLSPLSEPLVVNVMDFTGVTKIDATTIELAFSQNVSPTTGNNPANYFISNGVTVTAAAVQPTASRVRLTVSGLTDLQPVRVAPSNLTGASPGTVLLPGVTRVLNTGVTPGLAGVLYDYSTVGTIPTLPIGPVVATATTTAGLSYTWLTAAAPNPPFVGAPASTADTFATRWEGRITPNFTEPYTFFVTANDGVRVWIDTNNNGQFEDIPSERIIDQWQILAVPTSLPTYTSAPVNLNANQPYGIRVDQFDNQSFAQIKLDWQSARQNGGARQIVPNTNLANGTAETTAPTIQSIQVSGSSWSPAFTNAVQAAGLGTGGVDVPVGGSSPTLPWSSVNRVSIQFSEDMNIAQSSLVLNAGGGPVAVSDFSYDFRTYTATWTLAQPLPFGRFALSLSGASDLTGNGVSSPATPTYIRSNPGDVDRDGDVDANDFRSNLDKQFLSLGNAGYSIFHDVDANGAINVVDWQAVRFNSGHTLPAPSPAAAPVADVAAESLDASQESTTKAQPIRAAAVHRPRLASAYVDRSIGDETPPTTQATNVLRAKRNRAIRSDAATDAVLASQI